jgi:inner membrane protein
MTAEGHILFAIASAIVAKRAEFTPVLASADWWHILPAGILTCLMPDIDHPKSVLGQRLSWLSRPISRLFGHRGFTHSLLAIISGLILLHWQPNARVWFPTDILQGMVLGYLSHIVADTLTPAGVPLLWPWRFRFRLALIHSSNAPAIERYFCILLILTAIFTPSDIALQMEQQVLHQIKNSLTACKVKLISLLN